MNWELIQIHIEGTVTQLQTVQVLSLDHFALSEDDGVERTKEINTDAFYPSPAEAAKQKELQEMLVEAIMNFQTNNRKSYIFIIRMS
jgi:RNA polymerase sigma factor for flagellar operon FliA